MSFWIAASVILILVTASLLLALRGARGSVLTAADSDLRVYRDQLEEVDRDLARGVLTEAEAEAVRTEVSRRLLEADKRAHSAAEASTGQTGLAAGLVLLLVFAGGTGLYLVIGAPGYGDLPMQDRLAALERASNLRPNQEAAEAEAAAFLPQPPEADPSFLQLMDRLRGALAERPDDLQGLSLLARNEARLGNYAAARAAQARIIEVKGAEVEADDLVPLLDIMVFAAGGYVSPEAEAVVERLVELAPNSGQGRYYQGLTYAQTGRADLAFPIWRRLLEVSPPDAPWVAVIRDEIEAVAFAAGVNYQLPEAAQTRGPTQDDIANAAGMDDEDRSAMIEGMVIGLADRLGSEGGPPEEWAQLIRALGVLGRVDEARSIAAEARSVFAEADPLALEVIDQAISTLPE
ncbi:MAG: c-type cytochrome biogenesis protein CcmI [Rhodobacteraceae bacterium]|nr:c-type cytochrome biogenesis protein CcmI [Paracoccaceae bacterium]